MDKLLQFQNLIECASLDRKIKEHMDKITDEESRIDYVQSKKKLKEERHQELLELVSNLKQKSQGNESELHKYYKNQQKSQEHLSMAANQKQADSIENELKNLGEKIEELENIELEILEEIEEVEKENKEIKEFLQNIDDTITNLKNEVFEIKTVEQERIDQHQERIEKLLNEIDSNYKNSYLETNKKFRFKSPLTFVQQRKCRECLFEVDEQTRDSVDRNYQIEFCSSCGRMIVPISATNS